jgi:hypothetical protein
MLIKLQDRQREFLDMAHQWMRTKMLRQAGRFLNPGGAAATADGELALKCRSCPIPGLNLPPKWFLLPLASVRSITYSGSG